MAEVEESAPEELGEEEPVAEVEESAPEELGEERQHQREEEEERREGGGRGSTSTRVEKRPFSNEDEADSKATKRTVIFFCKILSFRK